MLIERELKTIRGYDRDSLKREVLKHATNIQVFSLEIEKAQRHINYLNSCLKYIDGELAEKEMVRVLKENHNANPV